MNSHALASGSSDLFLSVFNLSNFLPFFPIFFFFLLADRTNVGVAILAMEKEYEWQRTTTGWVLGIFFYGYTASQLLGSVR